jgi:hypothetical protein
VIYSAFDEASGYYRYYEDSRGHPVNADLPIPPIAPEAGRVGAPARECGRTLPLDARPIGTGWHARGLIVASAAPRVGVGDYAGPPPWKIGVGIALGAIVVWGVARYGRGR